MMTSDLTRKARIYLAASICFVLTPFVRAKPMDAEEGKKLPDIEEIVASVCSSGRLASIERNNVEKLFSSSNGVIVSLAAWITAQSKDFETGLCARAVQVGRSEGERRDDRGAEV